MRKETFLRIIMVMFLCMNLAAPPGLMAQGAKEEAPAFRPEEIDQMVAPIALYPDALLAQVFVASTYPLEVVQAGKFVQQNKDLKGEKLLAAAKDKEWDPSVKAMLSFPDVLVMMSDKLEWTEKLGNAFLDQQKDVMASVQRLRKKAQEAGNLKTTTEQTVVVEKETQVIVIQSASPEVVYVPTYNPTVVYGVWAYPAYPPPPVYAYPYGAGLAFAAGVAVGAAARSGYGGWGCGWGNNEININASTNNNFTKNNYNNPQKYQAKQNQSWQHNPEHRGNAQYKNQKTAQKYGQQGAGGGARAGTSEARGHGGGAGDKGAGKAQTSDASRGGGEKGGASAQTSDRSGGGGKENALSGADKGGNERASSNRGSESRSSASKSSGGSRSSSGGSRGGGGGGGGGGGRGGGGRR